MLRAWVVARSSVWAAKQTLCSSHSDAWGVCGQRLDFSGSGDATVLSLPGKLQAVASGACLPHRGT
eukprot:4259766-Alexandrium_andersonii.AAC.1